MSTTNMAENTTSSATDMGLISKLRDDDILLGRGQGASGYIGNRRMRRIVDTRREEYVTSDSHNVKKRISKEIYQQVRSKCGRFLCRVPPETLPESMRERTFYKEVVVAISLEKIKQSLREKQAPRKVKTDKSDANGDSSEKPVEDVQNHSGKLLERANEPPIITGSTSCILSSSERVQGVTKAPPSMNAASESVMSSVLQPPTSASGILPANLMQRTEPPLDASLLLLQSFALEQELMVNAVLQSSLKQMIGNRYLTHDLALQQDYQRYLNSWNPNLLCYPPANYAQLNTVSNDILGKATVAVQDTKQSSNEDSAGTDAKKLHDSSTCEQDVDVSESILSAIGLGLDQPRFTELEAQLEQEELTDEEKHTILSDLFGDKCSLLSHPKKKPRREFDARTIAYLVRQMRSEIEQMSLTKKQALVEAQVKSRVEEFSDSRLERFLRCEGMNAKLAAERFVRYWEARRELFGPDKYYLRMALSEAVRDDLAALRAGLFCILPHPDLSGRHLLFLEPTKHTREGYTSQSMLRALWYLVEIIIHQSKHTKFIIIVWDKDTTIWDFDNYLHQRMMFYFRSVFPISAHPAHVCSSPNIIRTVIKPIVCALLGKEGRARTIEHDAPEGEILDELSQYGIEKYMLPTQMGGTARLNLEEWIADRRATEMEEL